MSNLLGPLLGGVLTVTLGWRADWWALVPLTIAAWLAIARLLPVIVHAEVLVALLVGAAAPRETRRSPRGAAAPLIGFGASALGLTVLGIPGMTLDGLVTILPLIPIGPGFGMLFVPSSRAALNASAVALHGRTSALLSVSRLLGATVGAELAGIALSGTLTASIVHRTLLLGAMLCVVVGLPAATRLTSRVARRAPGSPPAPDRRHA